MKQFTITCLLSMGLMQTTCDSGIRRAVQSSEPNDVFVAYHGLRVPLGQIILVRRNSVYCAVRFIGFWNGETDQDWFASYESYYQGDNSGNLSKQNVQVRREELSSPRPRGIGRASFSFGNRDIECGDIKLRSSFFGWIYFFGSNQDPGEYGIELAPTQWTDVSQVNVSDPRVNWYKYDRRRQKFNIPIDKLWENTEEIEE